MVKDSVKLLSGVTKPVWAFALEVTECWAGCNSLCGGVPIACYELLWQINEIIGVK